MSGGRVDVRVPVRVPVRLGQRVGFDAVSSGAAPFSPSDIAGLELWLKADGTLWQDSARTTPATAAADPVGAWDDASGNARHFTQATAGSRPLLRLSEVNLKPAIQFDAVDDFLAGPNAFSGLTETEMFCVLRANADPTLGVAGCIWTFGSDAATDDIIPFTDGKIYDGFGSTSRKTTTDPAAPDLSTYFLYNVVSASGEWTDFLNGTQHFTTGTNTVGFSTTPFLGKTTTPFFGGHRFAELLFYNAKLSAGNKTSVKSYFATKYGLTIA